MNKEDEFVILTLQKFLKKREKQQATSNKQQAASNKQQATSGKQQAASYHEKGGECLKNI